MRGYPSSTDNAVIACLSFTLPVLRLESNWGSATLLDLLLYDALKSSWRATSLEELSCVLITISHPNGLTSGRHRCSASTSEGQPSLSLPGGSSS